MANNEPEHASVNDRLRAQREIILASINEVTADIELAMHDVGLEGFFPLDLIVPSSGGAVVRIAAPADPAVWFQLCEIARKVVGDRIGISLQGRLDTETVDTSG